MRVFILSGKGCSVNAVECGSDHPSNDDDRGYDLVTFFDCLHDMGDPSGAATHVLKTLKPDGT